MIKIAVSIVLFLALSGCSALPPALTYLGYLKTGADGISYLTTQKSTTDHLVSSALDKDCALHRVFLEEEVCHKYIETESVALLKETALDAKPAAGQNSK